MYLLWGAPYINEMNSVFPELEPYKELDLILPPVGPTLDSVKGLQYIY